MITLDASVPQTSGQPHAAPARDAAPSYPERFHALDATRAFALILGVVLHAVWFYSPFPLETPVQDVSANHAAGWMFFAIHTFRMQLFFLIAGFFARLVVQRRGLRAFARNRFKRIVVPFAVGWLILYPLLISTWIWGRNLSGQNIEPVPPHLVTVYLFISGAVAKEKAHGGSFSLLHLWFLAYLIYCCAIAAMGHALLQRFPWMHSRLRRIADRFLSVLTRPAVGILALAVIQAPFLIAMQGWLGIDTPAGSRTPVPAVLASYFLWFMVGWILHRQAHRLDSLFSGWRVHLALGLAGSAALYACYIGLGVSGTPKLEGLLSHHDLHDWQALRSSLLANQQIDDNPNPMQRLWFCLPERTRNFVREKESLSPDERTGVIALLNKLLLDPDLLTRDVTPDSAPPEARATKASPAALAGNRAALESHWSGVTPLGKSRHLQAGRHKPIYSLGYALTTALLVFGCLGAFQSLCRNHSPAWRYVADSSYWIYLAHLPLLPAIEILMFRWEISAAIKLPLLCGGSLILLFASYQYLVRSTFIGKVLNGRAHPLEGNLFRALK